MTTKAITEFESTEGMTDACAAGLHNLLVACADTKLLLGYHYGEWTFGPPVLEAAVANCSLSQTELGHVRLLHAILKKHYGDDPDALVEQRDAAVFANITCLNREISDWAGLVAANFVVDMAVTRILHSMKGSSFKPLRMSVDKMLDEERYHVHHGQGWFRTLASRSDEARDILGARARNALTAVVEWFGPDDEAEDQALVDAKIKSRANSEILDDLVDDVRATANELGVNVDADTPESFEGWTPVTRRISQTGPDEDILYHLRGSKNAIFKLS